MFKLMVEHNICLERPEEQADVKRKKLEKWSSLTI